jgi:hypothetical protein
MTMSELATQLAPLTNEALASTDHDVTRVAVILAAVMGCITPPVDDEALQPLVIAAGLICEHRTGRHQRKSQH